MRIGITGTIGAGKSSVATYLRDCGYFVVDTDAMVHEYYQPGQPIYDLIVSEFGVSILDEHRQIDRKRLAQRVFSNPDDLHKLESWAFERVRADLIEMFSSSIEENIFVEVPLLFEAKMNDLFDFIIVIDADEALRFKRLQRRGITKEDAIARAKRQLSGTEKRSQADFIIDNNETIELLKEQVDRALERINDGKRN